MQLISAAKMKKQEKKALIGKQYTQELIQMLAKVSTDESIKLSNPYFAESTKGQALFIIFNPNRGFAGLLTYGLVKKFIKSLDIKTNKKTAILVGKKLGNIVASRLENIHADFSDIPEDLKIEDIQALAKVVKKGFLDKTFNEVYFIYADYENAIKQTPKIQKILPIAPNLQTVGTGEDIDVKDKTSSLENVSFEFEPNKNKLVNSIIELYINTQLYQARVETIASEYAARMVAMKNATDNADELGKDLQLAFNQTRQTIITNELAEINASLL